MTKILVIHGPNLNLLGSRENKIYGHTSLDTLNQNLQKKAQAWGLSLESMQSNAEHELIEIIQNAPQSKIDFIIINPAAFTHTSIGIRDAFLATAIPFIEVHLSNIKAREDFRAKSYLSDIAKGVIFGFGPLSYELALYGAHQYFITQKE